MSEFQEAIIDTLSRKGGLTADELCQELLATAEQISWNLALLQVSKTVKAVDGEFFLISEFGEKTFD